MRAEDLRFTLDEARTFLIGAIGKEIQEEWVQRLQERVAGWAAGLRFASVLLRERASGAQILERLVTQEDRHLTAYLMDEVLSQKSPAVQNFMLKTAFLERFSAGSCDAILDLRDGENSYAILDELVRDDLLSIERTGQERWYTYMDLLGEFLRARALALYNTEQIAQIHQRASAWFVKHGLITEAIRHSIAAGDLDGAARLVGENIEEAFDHEVVRPLIEAWLGLFPEEMLDQHPELIIARAMLLGMEMRIGALPPLLARAEQLIGGATELTPAARNRILGHIAQQRIFLAYFTNDGARALEIDSHNQQNLPRASGFDRGNNLMFRAWAYQMVGESELAFRLLTDAMRQDGSLSTPFALRLMLGFVTLYLNNADLMNLEQTGLNLLRFGTGYSNLNVGWTNYFLGLVNYEWNQLEAAAQYFSVAAELRYQGNLKAGHEGLAWLAQTQQAQGLSEAARATMQDLLSFTSQTHSGALQLDADAYRARLAMMQGNVDAALRWAQTLGFNPRPHMLFEVEPYLTRLRILLASRKREYFQTVLDETNALLTHAQATHNTRRLIQFYTLQAMARNALGNRVLALDSLEQAITLAEPGRLLRTFIDLEPDIAGLLNQIATRSKTSQYIHRILAAGAFHQKGQLFQGMEGDQSSRLIEPLTVRELQIMQCLAGQMSNKEIAQKLVISPFTVKSHIDHIRQKLAVSTRQEAVRVALSYGIIELPANSSAFTL